MVKYGVSFLFCFRNYDEVIPFAKHRQSKNKNRLHEDDEKCDEVSFSHDRQHGGAANGNAMPDVVMVENELYE